MGLLWFSFLPSRNHFLSNHIEQHDSFQKRLQPYLRLFASNFLPAQQPFCLSLSQISVAYEKQNGKILNGRFSRYRVPRFQDLPQIEVVLVDRKDIPSAGAGETPIVGIAPAIGNAIFNATGQRLRFLPLTL
jgi:hypothetical protein